MKPSKFLIALTMALIMQVLTAFASPLPNLFEENFENDLSKWTLKNSSATYCSSEIKNEDGKNVLAVIIGKGLETAAPPPRNAKAIAGDSSWSDYTVSLRAKIQEKSSAGKTNEYCSFMLRYQASPETYYGFIWTRYESGYVCLVDSKMSSESGILAGTKVATSSIAGYNPYTWNDYKFVLTGNNIKVFINGAKIIDYTDSSNKHPNGKFGIASYGSYGIDTHFFIDDIEIYSESSVIENVTAQDKQGNSYSLSGNQTVAGILDNIKIDYTADIATSSELKLKLSDVRTGEQIPFDISERSEKNLLIKPKVRLSSNSEYKIEYGETVLSDNTVLTGIIPLKFITMPDAISINLSKSVQEEQTAVTAKAVFNLPGLTDNAVLIIAAYKNGILVDIKGQAVNTVSDSFSNNFNNSIYKGAKVTAYAFDNIFGNSILSEPVTIDL